MSFTVFKGWWYSSYEQYATFCWPRTSSKTSVIVFSIWHVTLYRPVSPFLGYCLFQTFASVVRPCNWREAMGSSNQLGGLLSLRNLVVYSCLSNPLYMNDKRFYGFLFSSQSLLDDLQVFSNVDWIRDPTNRGSTIVYYFPLADYFIKYVVVCSSINYYALIDTNSKLL